MRMKRENIFGMDFNATAKVVGRLISKSALSDKDLGKFMGLSVQSVNKWRNAKSMPDLDNLYILSRLLNVKIDDFIVPYIFCFESENKFCSEFLYLLAFYIKIGYYSRKK